jgi:hypothetical protein
MRVALRRVKVDKPYSCKQCSKKREYCQEKCKGESVVWQWRNVKCKR